MREIAEWLEKLGMSEYAQRFAENESISRSAPSNRSSLKDSAFPRAPLKILAAITGWRPGASSV